MREVRVCQVSEVAPDSAVCVVVGGERVAIVRIGQDEWHAVGDVCTHQDFSLADGLVWPDERRIECPQHGAQFSLETGAPCTLPATKPVVVYKVRADAGDVMVEIP